MLSKGGSVLGQAGCQLTGGYGQLITGRAGWGVFEGTILLVGWSVIQKSFLKHGAQEPPEGAGSEMGPK